MIDTLRAVRSQEYHKLWDKVPGAVGSAAWAVEIAAMGWGTGIWTGAVTVAALTVLSRVLPSAWRPVEWIVDAAYYTVMRSMVSRAIWLLLLLDLWVLQDKGPWSIPLVLFVFIAAFVLPFVTRRLIGFVPGLAAGVH